MIIGVKLYIFIKNKLYVVKILFFFNFNKTTSASNITSTIINITV